MIEGLKPYAEYKESGSTWLGAIPANWDVRNLRTLITRRNERNRPDLPLLSVAREKGVFVRSLTDADENHNVIPEDLSNYKVARDGNLVINKMKAWQGSMGIAPCDGIVSPAYFVFDFQIANLTFGQMLLRSKPYVAHFGQVSDGVRVGQWDLSIPGMRQIPVLVPDEEEQAAIVRFLDHANRKIDRFIRAKRKLIELLGEQKQAIIHRAVTCGLSPNVSYKTSDVPWLGDIPEHWDIWRIGRFAKVGNGSTPSRGKQEYWTGGSFPWLNSSQVNRELIKSADQFVTPLALQECHLPKVQIGSVLVAITGQGKTRGKSAVLAINATINQHLAYITSRPSIISSDFLHLVLMAAYSTLRALSEDSGSTKGALTCEDLKRFKLPVPPFNEQEQLVKTISRKTSTTNIAITRTEREIALMLEYRTRLTADIVTGKLDVREAAAKLPDLPTDTDYSSDAKTQDEELFEEPESGEE